MKEHVARMIDEYTKLGDDIKALNAFIHGNPIFKTLCDLEQALMIKQSGFMESHQQVLGARLCFAK